MGKKKEGEIKEEPIVETPVEVPAREKPKKDYVGYDNFIKKYVLASSGEQLQAVIEGIEKFHIGKTEATKLLKDKVSAIEKQKKQEQKEKLDAEKIEQKKQQEEEKEKRLQQKTEKEREKEEARKEKEEARQKIQLERMKMLEEKQEAKKLKEAEELQEKQTKQLLLDELELNWKTCDNELFQNVCEADYRKAYYYLAERLMFENTFKTFKDNGDIIRYEPLQGIYSQRAEIFIAIKVKEVLGEKALDFAIKEIQNSIRRSTYVDRNILYNQPKHLKPVKNGLWNFNEKKLNPFSSDYIFLDRIEVDYIATADCPKFKKFLTEILDTDKERQVVQEWTGNCLLNDNRFQKAMLLYGDGANGKSVLLKVVKYFLGDNNVANIALQHLEANTFALARLFGKSANIFFDLPKKALSQTSNFKIVVSGDSVSGEKKGKDSFEFIPYTKMMFSCNEVPRTPDRTPAFFRRWIVLKFNQHFSEGDPRRVENKEKEFFNDAEMQGILVWALEGLDRLITAKKFTEHLSQKDIEDFWTRHSDSVAAFTLDLVSKDLAGREMKQNVFDTYGSYCKINGYTPEEQNHFWKRFGDLVEFQDVQLKEDDKRRSCKGFTLKPLSVVKTAISENNNE
jgi:putative DNA primase/helicase